MNEEIRKKLQKDSGNLEYSNEEIEFAVNEISRFLNKLQNMKVYENNTERNLNQLEMFIAINEFVTNRNYEESADSHYVVGALNSKKIVCEGFSKLTQVLCDMVGIKTLYKHSEISDKEANYLGPHGNIEVCIADKNGMKHCLHNDSTIDCINHEKDKENMTYTAMLICDEDINKYYHKNNWNTNDIWVALANGENIGEFKQSIEPQMMDEIWGTDRVGRNIPPMEEMLSFMGINETTPIETEEDLIKMYELVYNEYQKAKGPIDNDELLEALVNVQKANLAYETNLPEAEISSRSIEVIRERIKESLKYQQRDWENATGKSFLFDIVNGKYDYEKKLDSLEQVPLKNMIEPSLRKGIDSQDCLSAEESERGKEIESVDKAK